MSGQHLLLRRVDEILGRQNRAFELLSGGGGVGLPDSLAIAEGASDRPGPSSASPAARRAPFVVEEALVQQVMEMGFGRSEIVRAATTLRSNDAGEVTGFLLEGGEMYGEGIEFAVDEEVGGAEAWV